MLRFAVLKQTVRILGGVESALRGGHVAPHVVEDIARDTFVKRIARDLECVEIGARKLRLVVEHFFEVRDVPETVNRVAVETAAEMVVHSAVGHFAQREKAHVERARIAFERVEPQQKIQRNGARKFRSTAEPAEIVIEAVRDFFKCGAEDFSIGHRAVVRFGCGVFAQRGDRLLALLHEPRTVVFPGGGDACEQRCEAGASVAILRRKIGAAEERLQIRREPDAHRPTAGAGGCLHEGHVNLVHVGAFLAVDFDAYEIFVEDSCDRRVLKRLVRHDMAPVAGRVADGQKNRLPLAARLFKSLRTPRKPVHRIVRVLEQVGRFLAREPVRGMRDVFCFFHGVVLTMSDHSNE